MDVREKEGIPEDMDITVFREYETFFYDDFDGFFLGNNSKKSAKKQKKRKAKSNNNNAKTVFLTKLKPNSLFILSLNSYFIIFFFLGGPTLNCIF